MGMYQRMEIGVILKTQRKVSRQQIKVKDKHFSTFRLFLLVGNDFALVFALDCTISDQEQ